MDTSGVSTVHAAEVLDVVTDLNEYRFAVLITHDVRGKQHTKVTAANELQTALTICKKKNQSSTSDAIKTHCVRF
jgi:hypothetical protein